MVQSAVSEGVIGERFRMDREIKRSASTTTFLGTDLQTGEAVVIKTAALAAVSPGAHVRLVHESDVLRSVRSAAIAPLLGQGVDAGLLYFVMPYIDGMALSDRLQSGPLSLDEAVAVAQDVLRALQEAHDSGILHLDVKPANIILNRFRQAVHATLIDFGLSYTRQLDSTVRSEIVGTARYMSPEQAGMLGQGVDERADLYSLGVVLFECLAGVPPFQGVTIGEVLREHLAVPAPQLRGLGLAVPRALDAVVQRLLRKDPRDRYQSAAAALADLDAIAAALASGESDPPVVIGLKDQRLTLAEPAFVGRNDELAALEAQVAAAARGEGGLVLVEAVSGGGKTRLLDELAQRSAAQGMLVLRGRSLDQAAPRPFQALVGIAIGMIANGRADPAWQDAVQAAMGEHASAAVETIPELAGVLGPGLAPAAGPEQMAEARSIMALTALLAAVGSGQRPALLLLDDCQWADEVTLRLLGAWPFAGEQHGSPERHTTIVAAFRSEEVDAYQLLRRVPAALHLRLPPLEANAIRQLVESMAGPVPDEALVVVQRLAEGSPFMASAVLRGLVESAALTGATGGWQVERLALAEAQSSRQAAVFLTRRLEILPAPVLQFLTAGAVLGKEFDLGMAATLTGHTPAQAVEALDVARRRHIVWAQSDGTHCTFVHDRLREVLLDRLSSGERQMLHRRAVEWITWEGSERDFNLAYHWDAAGDPARALSFALRAAELARTQHALEPAEQLYRIAARGVPSGEFDLRCRIATGLGDILQLRSRYEEAAASYEVARSFTANALTQAELDGKLAELAFKSGDARAANAAYERALRKLGWRVPSRPWAYLVLLLWEVVVQTAHSLAPRWFLARRSLESGGAALLAARLCQRLATSYYYEGGSIPCAWAHFRMLNEAERFPPTDELAQAYADHAAVVAMVPMYGRSLSYARRSLEIRRAKDFLWGQGQSLCYYAAMLHSASFWDESGERAQEAIRILRRTGDEWQQNAAMLQIALSQYRRGDLRAAIETARALYQSARRLGDTHATAALSVWSRAARGHAPAEVLREDAERPHNDLDRVMALEAYGVHLLAADDLEQASAVLEQAQEIVNHARLRQEYVAALPAWLATARRLRLERTTAYDPHHRAALLRAAQRAAGDALKVARAYRNNLPHALRERGLVAALAGQPKAARLALDESLTVAQQMGARHELAQSLLARGVVGAVLGWSGAAEDAASARRALQELEATPPAAPTTVVHPDVTLSLAARFTSIMEIGRRIASALTHEAVYGAAQAAAAELLRPEHTVILEIGPTADPDGNVTMHPATNAAGLPISRSLVMEAIAAQRPITVSEESAASESLVLSGTRSALCAPVLVHGRAVLCLYATHGQIGGLFGEDEVRLAEFISTLAGAALENVEGIAEIEELQEHRRREELERALLHEEFRHAADIQQRLIPTDLPGWPGGVEVASRFRAAREASGDFFDVLALPGHPGQEGTPPMQIAVGDVAGKGIAAALVMAIAQTTLRTIARQTAASDQTTGSALPDTLSPARTLGKANRLLHQYVGARDFVACALAVVEQVQQSPPRPAAVRLHLANAGQVRPLLWRDGTVVELVQPGDSLPLGVDPDIDYADLVTDLRPGDVLVFASDGLPEAPASSHDPTAAAGPFGEFFGFDRLTATLARLAAQGIAAEAVAAGIWAEITAWSGEASRHDDMTLLVLRLPPQA